MRPYVLALLLSLTSAGALYAQEPDDAALRLAEPDFTLVALPTSLPLPLYKSAFRVTHRFLRPIGAGDAGDFFGSAFGIDQGAQIGLEYRFGIIKHGQVGVNRTSNRTVEFFGHYELMDQGKTSPVSVGVLVAVEGQNNFKEEYSPTIGAVISHTVGDQAALYVEPMLVHNTNPLQADGSTSNDTFMVGLGARVRVSPSVYLVGEVTPRVGGYRPGSPQGAFAIEKRAGGHMFQLNFGNGVGTLSGQLAHGTRPTNDWYMGFNISRKFF